MGVSVRYVLRAVCAFTILIILNACQTASAPQDPSLALDNAALIYIYRTQRSFHSLNPEKPYFYIDGEHVANLGTGQTAQRLVPPGQHRISVRGTFMFAPAGEIGGIDIVTEVGKTYYIRYSHDFGGAFGTMINSTHSLQVVDAAAFNERL